MMGFYDLSPDLPLYSQFKLLFADKANSKNRNISTAKDVAGAFLGR